MNYKNSLCITTTLFITLSVPLSFAQDHSEHRGKHVNYQLFDLGTFGGPNSYIPNFSLVSVNSQGAVIVEADTTIPDPYPPNCFQSTCLVNHAGVWRDGVLTDLGALPGTNSSAPQCINNRGESVGISENGLIDPLTGVPEEYAVIWKQGHIIDLGTLGGNPAWPLPSMIVTK